GGGRTLFFNPANDAAWVVDLGIGDIANHGQHSDRTANLSILVPGPTNATRVHIPVTVSGLNRTFVNLGLGREWYLSGEGGNCPTCGTFGAGTNWRAGFDIGG